MTEVLPFLIPIVAILTGGLIVLIPMAGLTARFALKPIVEAVARLREGQTGASGREFAIMEQRVALLEQQVQAMETALDRLGTARDFDRQLADPNR
ncbi:MAG TPA: hypothetical protein VFQ38_13990 [Longimicrobiales bacterium]|nr:hypothetical protein [Longimicrobiales bacterium]